MAIGEMTRDMATAPSTIRMAQGTKARCLLASHMAAASPTIWTAQGTKARCLLARHMAEASPTILAAIGEKASGKMSLEFDGDSIYEPKQSER